MLSPSLPPPLPPQKQRALVITSLYSITNTDTFVYNTLTYSAVYSGLGHRPSPQYHDYGQAVHRYQTDPGRDGTPGHMRSRLLARAHTTTHD